MKLWSWLKGKTHKDVVPEALIASPIDVHPETSYSNDQPIRSAADDRFARAPFAMRIAETIAARQDPSSLVLGLYGPWGDGKTSVLYMIEERLKTEANVIVVRFNPWHFTTVEQLIRGFFGTLASALGKSLTTTGEKIGETIKKYESLLSIASTSVAGGAVTLNPGQAALGIGKALSATTLDELKNRIEKNLSDSGKKVVVLIDDIDRLDRAETHAIFKLVKLSADFDHTTYLLAFDKNVVAAALGERYGEGGHAAGIAFLEKIIQVPLYLSPADPIALRNLAYEGVDKALNLAAISIEQADIDLFTIQFTSGLEPKLETPRQAHLYSNALMFSLPLIKGEVNIVDFMLVEGLRIFYPKLHGAIRDNPSPWQDQQGWTQQDRLQRIEQIVSKSMLDRTEEEQKYLKRGLLKYLFPRIANEKYGSEWETTWARDKRVCSQAYFQRYFTYGVPPNDISDRAIDELVASAQNLEVVSRAEALLQLMRKAPAVFIKKMRQREEKVTDTQAQALIQVLAPNGDSAPVERGLFVMGGTRTQAAILIAHLLRRIPKGDSRNRVATEIVELATPLTFAVECERWMMPGRDDTEERHLLTKEVLDSLEAILVARTVQADLESPLYRQFGSEARKLYWLWRKADADGISTRVRENLGRTDEEVDAFLDIYVGETWGMEDGLPGRADFRKEFYDDIALLIDPADITRLLRDRYGAELDQPEFYHGAEIAIPRRIAHQFMVVHNAVMEEFEQAQGGNPTLSQD